MDGNQGYRNGLNDYYHSSSGTGRGASESSLNRNGYTQRAYSQDTYSRSGYTGSGYTQGGYTQNGYTQSSYTQSGYSQGTASASGPQTARASVPSPAPKAAAPRKKGGIMKKVLAGALIGVVFGVFAGGGFLAVSAAGNFVKERIPSIETSSDKQDQAAIDTVAASQSTAAATTTDPVETLLPDNQTTAAPAASSTGDPIQNVVTTTVTDVTEVVKNTMPALVSVNNKYTEMLNYFGQTYYQDAEGAGSGIIVGQNDDQLLIVTNYHVVKDAKELTVTFDDNSEAEAKLEGKDADKDLAVISVQTALISADTKNAISVAKLGDSDTLTVGEPVIAIGNSLGYGQSVTTGVVSALNRPIAAALSDEEYGDKEIATFIQTDAAINPGNSGGALLNISGEVIGINSNKIGGSVVEGMGYAIPISSAKPIIENMINKQTRTRVDEGSKGVLGITGVDVDADLSLSYGIPMGVYISSVNEGSGADAAGLMKGDIITGMNGEDISCMDDLKNELSYFSAGQTVQLQIMQGTPVGYQKKTIEVVLQAAPQ